MNTSHHCRHRPLGALSLGAAVGLLALSSYATSIEVDARVTPLGGSFRYDLSVSNFESEDLAILTLNDAPTGDALIGSTLRAPAGFLTSYDSPLGLIDFLADSSGFAMGSTISGLSFESTQGPDAFFSTFEAIGIFGSLYSGTIRTSTVPDSGSALAILALSSVALGAFARRRVSCP